MGNRGPYAKSAQTQEQILAAALDSVSVNGYRSTSLQQIADAVGMSKPGLLHHFDSRDRLLVAILERRDEVSMELMAFEEDAIDGFVALAESNGHVPGLVALFAATIGVGASERADSPKRAFVLFRYPRIVRELTEAAEARQAAGTMRSDLAAASIARLIVATADGLQLQWLTDESVDMRRELEALVQSFGTSPAG